LQVSALAVNSMFVPVSVEAYKSFSSSVDA
jgi:hypothetical protein